MASPKINWFYLLFFVLASIIPALNAHIANNWDEHWMQKKAKAHKQTQIIYDKNSQRNAFLAKLHKEKALAAKSKAKADAGAELKSHAEAHGKLMVKGDAEAEVKLIGKGEVEVYHKKKMVGRGFPLRSSNDTRRELRGQKYSGPCMAINSIDKCWRCDKNWALNRKRLASCARGFGQRAQGGMAGRIYVVNDPSDNNVVNPKPGTLRHAVIQLVPLWIIFSRSMTIKLQQELIMTSHKTIDARGANVHIAYGAGFTIQFVRNIIIHNLHIHNIYESSGGMIRDSVNHFGFRTRNEGDGITIFGSRDIWLDHLSMSRAKDGLIDAVQGSTAITISNCHFTDHDKVLLFGASDTTTVDDKMQITVAFNHFGKRLIQRMPRCRSGFFHLVNNDYTHWEMYAIGGSHHATIISQGNRFIAPPNLPPWKKSMLEITHRDSSSDWKKWTWVSDGDIFQNGAFFRPSGDKNGARTYAALELIKAAPANQVGQLTKFSGSLDCRPGVPC